MNGLLLVDKPSGMTSHDVVGRIRRTARMKRVGHTGTLDPSATGLLIICVGKATRLSEFITGAEKTYEGTFRLGLETDSYDLDGQVLAEHEVPPLALAELQAACNAYTGTIEQLPPMVSAVKIGGERLYKKARRGEVVDRPSRTVQVFEFSVLDLSSPLASFRIRCSSGTYVRSLCHDVGVRLGCGATLASLRRTVVGPRTVDEAATLETLDTPEAVRQHLIPMNQALDLPKLTVHAEREHVVATGGSLTADDLVPVEIAATDWVQLFSTGGQLLALAQLKRDNEDWLIYPKRVFCGD